MLRVSRLLPLLALSLVGTAASRAAVVTTTSQGASFDSQISSTDLLEGLIPAVLPGDKGWHPANPAAGNSMDPNGLPAFTDGRGPVSGVTGLLNDFPGAGQPAKSIEYTLAAPSDIGAINVFSGNDGKDGRVFHTYTVEFSSNGTAWSAPLYVQSHKSGTLNKAPDNFRAVMTQTSDPTAPLALGAQYLRFNFYAVSNTQGEMHDPFDGVNPFTGVDDGLTAAIESPLIWEIDVLGPQAGAIPEPSSVLLLATGLGALLPLARRRR